MQEILLSQEEENLIEENDAKSQTNQEQLKDRLKALNFNDQQSNQPSQKSYFSEIKSSKSPHKTSKADSIN